MISVVDGAPKPGLRPAEEGQSDVAANNQPLSSIDELHGRAVGLAILRIENLAATPLIAIRPHVAYDLHTDDALSLAIAAAFPQTLSSGSAATSSSRTTPESSPFISRISTTAVGLPSASLIVFQKPT